jgi:hypothetical protein
MCDLLAGHDDVADQAGEIAAYTRDRALFFDDELDQTLAHVLSPHNYKFIGVRFYRFSVLLSTAI